MADLFDRFDKDGDRMIRKREFLVAMKLFINDETRWEEVSAGGARWCMLAGRVWCIPVGRVSSSLLDHGTHANGSTPRANDGTPHANDGTHTLVDIRTQPRLKPTDMCPPPPARQGVRDAIDEIWAAMSALVGVKKRAAYESRRNGKKAGEARVLVGPREFDKWLSEGKSCTWLPGSSLPVTCRSERKSCEWLVEVSHTNGTRWIRS